MAKKTKKKVLKKAAKKKTAKKTSKKTTKKVNKKVAKKTAKKTSKKLQSASVIKGASLRIGDTAPPFTLKDQNGKDVSLSDFRGRNVVVYFYPRALTPGCTVQACGLRDVWTELKELDVVILGISGDSPKKLKQFEEKKELNFILLSDEDHAVARTYHSWGQKKFMGRTFDGILRQSFFIDGEGKIIGILHKVDTASHHETVVEFFRNQK
jgi:peroxiredoxin Q/BCP